MADNRRWQLELCKRMSTTIKEVSSCCFLKTFKRDPLRAIMLIVMTFLFCLADLIRMSFDREYPPKPEYKNVNGKITMLS